MGIKIVGNLVKKNMLIEYMYNYKECWVMWNVTYFIYDFYFNIGCLNYVDIIFFIFYKIWSCFKDFVIKILLEYNIF